jgi:hypothetical protein
VSGVLLASAFEGGVMESEWWYDGERAGVCGFDRF